MIGLDKTYYEPVFYDDEHYLSVFNRWALLSGAGRLQHGLQVLSNYKSYNIRSALQPKFLETVLNALPAQFETQLFLENHTQERFLRTIEKKTGSALFSKVQRVGALLLNHHLRWCPACAKEDEQHLGTSYWRNSHQDSRLLRCQRHQLSLVSTCHRCKRKSLSLNDLMLPKTKVQCSRCSEPLGSYRLMSLAPFQLWLEKLHHLANHGIQVNRKTLVEKVLTLVDTKEQKTLLRSRRCYVSPDRIFIEAYNQNKVYEHTGTGEIPFDIIQSWTQLRIKNVLKLEVVYPPEIYALLGWVFLDDAERDALFGTFKNSQAIQVAA